MARTLLRRIATIAVSLLLTIAIFFGVAVWRRSSDTTWCRKAAASRVTSDATAPVVPDLLDNERAACVVQRQRQRVMFGTVWRAGGEAMATCGFEWARYGMLTDQSREAAAAILKSYGIEDPDFDSSSRTDQNQFVQTCLAKGGHR